MTEPKSQTARLRVLATSDVHMHLLPYDYFADVPTPGKGLHALSSVMSDLRREAAAESPPRRVLLVDNGDTLQGSVLGDRLANALPHEGIHPLAKVMNALGYDAMGLGNHDLDYGLDYLGWFARSLDAPLVSSNTILDPPLDWLAPYCVLPVGDVDVGILSILPPRTVKALHAKIGDAAVVVDMIWAVQRAARKLRERGADIVLALAHTGLDPNDNEQVLEEIARDGNVDALVGGHQHGVFPGHVPEGVVADTHAGTLHGVPTAMPGCEGALLGCIDLDLERTSDGGWTVANGAARVVPPCPAAHCEDSAFDPIRPAHAATCAALDTVIGKTSVPLTSYFAQVRPTSIHEVTAAAQCAVIDAERQGTPLAALPLLSAVSLPRAGGTGGAQNYVDIPAGPLTARHLAALNVYSHQVWAVQVTGAELAEWLERSVSAFARIPRDGAPHGSDQTSDRTAGGLFDTDFPAFDFDVIHGISYAIDPTAPARYDRSGKLRHPESRRVSRIAHEGLPVAPEAQFLVAVNSFRACGGGQFPGLHPDRPVLRPELPVAEALRSFLSSGAEPDRQEPWQFAETCAGIATWFETGAGAVKHLEEIAHLSPGRPQPQPSGFVRIPITL